MTEIKNTKQLAFDLICNLVLVICYFSPSRRLYEPEAGLSGCKNIAGKGGADNHNNSPGVEPQPAKLT